jgi:hypothetical protein
MKKITKVLLIMLLGILMLSTFVFADEAEESNSNIIPSTNIVTVENVPSNNDVAPTSGNFVLNLSLVIIGLVLVIMGFMLLGKLKDMDE